MAKANAPLPVEMARVEFLADGVLIGTRCFSRGQVAEIPADRLKELIDNRKAKGSDEPLTSFAPAAENATAKKPRETR